MRINSNFKDYYDGVIRSLDHDPTPFYDRTTKEIHLRAPSPEKQVLQAIPLLKSIPLIRAYEVHTYVLAICGRLHVCYNNNYDLLGFCQDLEEHDGKVSNFAAKRRDWSNARSTSAALRIYSSKRHQRDVSNFLAMDHNIGWDSHLALKTPIWMIKYECVDAFLYLNPCLRDHNFAGQVDAHQMYQNLSYYFDNILVGQLDPPPTTGGDEIVRDAKGFDKWSFKRHRDDPR